MSAGVLIRLGLGIYAKAKPSVLTGEPIPAQPVEVLGPLALTMLGVNVGRQRITRNMSFIGKFLKYERG